MFFSRLLVELEWLEEHPLALSYSLWCECAINIKYVPHIWIHAVLCRFSVLLLRSLSLLLLGFDYVSPLPTHAPISIHIVDICVNINAFCARVFIRCASSFLYIKHIWACAWTHLVNMIFVGNKFQKLTINGNAMETTVWKMAKVWNYQTH